MNIFEQYGIKEVADVTLYAIELDENDDEIYIPVLYMDTLKVSTVEESSSQANAQGGIGNPKLITWDYGKDITVTLEDALFTPASASMNWGGKLGVKGLQLYLSHFYDRNTDNNTPDTCLRTATLNVEKFSDFFIIPDRWPHYSKKKKCGEGCCNDNVEEPVRSVGETSIYCWLVNGYIVSNDNKKRVSFENLILFYREITQRWHLFNYYPLLKWLGDPDIDEDGKVNSSDVSEIRRYFDFGVFCSDNETEEDTKKYYDRANFFGEIKITDGYFNAGIVSDFYATLSTSHSWRIEDWEKFLFDNYRDKIKIGDNFLNNGKYIFEQIKQGLLNDFNELVEETTWTVQEDCDEEVAIPWFLTDRLYLDGYRPGCARTQKYSNMTLEEYFHFKRKEYIPYRYFGYIGVEYNTNVVPPQDVIYKTDTAYKDIELLEKMEKCCATNTFCIDTDINMKHGQYRYLTEYSQTELSVFINPDTMHPYQPNAYEFYRKNGQRVTGNLRIIKCGEYYYKWTRTKAEKHNALGKQLIIDPQHFPGTYRLVGETYKRNRYGEDKHYQFEIPLCKLHADNKLTLQADGDPTVFSMKLTALRRYDGVMMKLTEYSTVNKTYCSNKSDSEKVVPYVNPNPELEPKSYDGDYDLSENIDWRIEALSPRSIAATLVAKTDEEKEGFFKAEDTPSTDTAENKSKVSVSINGQLHLEKKSIDGSIINVVDGDVVSFSPDKFNARIQGGDAL